MRLPAVAAPRRAPNAGLMHTRDCGDCKPNSATVITARQQFVITRVSTAPAPSSRGRAARPAGTCPPRRAARRPAPRPSPRPCAGAARRRPARAVSALSSTSDQAPTVSPAKQGLAWAPALIAATTWALASPLKLQRAGEADDVAAVDQPPAVLARGGVEVHLARCSARAGWRACARPPRSSPGRRGRSARRPRSRPSARARRRARSRSR